MNLKYVIAAVLFWFGVSMLTDRAEGFTSSKPPVLSPTPPATRFPTPTPTPVQSAGQTLEKIKSLAGASTCAKYRWKDRGLAPAGYVKGSAIVYARAFCQRETAFQKVVSQPVGGEKDVLNRYAATLKAEGVPVATSEQRLRAVYTILFGLGMRESSGKYCCGRDASMDFTAADTAESGLMQTSWNVRVVSPELPKLFAAYQGGRDCGLATFKEGVPASYCEKPSQVKLWGNPAHSGYAFQKLHKQCPALSVEFAAGVVRFSGGSKSHYGPFRTKASEVRKECFDLLGQIEKMVRDNPSVCAAF